MPMFRKKPVEIEAVQLTESTFEEAEIFLGYEPHLMRHYNHEGDFLAERNPQGLHIKTLEGVMQAKIGDYIIRGVKGEFYPCKPDIFEITYDKCQ